MPRRRRFSALLLASACLTFAGPARAEPESAALKIEGNVPAPAAAAVVAVGAGLDLAIPSLQARAKKIEAAHPTPDETIAAALRDYAAAVDQLEIAAEWKQRSDALARVQRDGPRTLEATRREVDAWAAQPQPALSAEASQNEIEDLLAESEARLAVLRRQLAEVDAEQTRIADRRLVLPAELAAAGAAREGNLDDIGLPPLPTGSVESTLARRALAMATQKAAAEQSAALELELATQELRRELLGARRDLLRRKADSFAARVAALQGALAERRVREAEETATEARADQESLKRVHPILGTLAAENARLTAERAGEDGLTAKLDAVGRRLGAVAEQLQQLEERSKGVRQKVAAAGLTDAIGLLLRKERSDLPEAARLRADIRARRSEISEVQLETLTLEDLSKGLPAVESEVEGILRSQAAAIGDGDRERIEASARNVLKTRRSYLDALIRDSNAYFAALVDLDARETELLRLLEDYTNYLDQHVLWIPNTTPPNLSQLADWRDAALWIVDPRNAIAAATRLLNTATSSPFRTSLGLLLLLAAVAYRRRVKGLYTEICTRRSVPEGFPMPAPAAALGLAVLLSVPGAFALWFLSWMLRAAPETPDDFSAALAATLSVVFFPLFIGELNRRVTAKDGAVQAFLQWPRAVLALVRGQIGFVEVTVLPIFCIALLLDAQPQENWSESLGRAAFCLAVGIAGFAAHRLFHPSGHLVELVLRRTDLEWIRPLLSRASWLPSTIAAVIIGIALVGYYYTAIVLIQRIWLSAIVILAFLVANAGALRWLAIKAMAPPTEILGAEEGKDAVAAVAPEEAMAAEAEAIARVSTQTRSLLRMVFGLTLFVALFSVWADVFPALRFFERIELYEVSATVEKTVGSGDTALVQTVPTRVPVTVANLMLALLGAALALFGARNLPGLLELAVLSRLHLDRGLRYAISTVTRYVVFVAGTVFALRNLGVEWSNVQWLVAAISVGLGFGLQEIFGNFVSGLIVLFERPVRVGDTVTIDNTTGVVARIEMRATTIIDGDRKELIVPNKELITGKLVNWSLHDPTVRLVVPVSVAYGSDVAAVERILSEVAKQSPLVLENPAPIVAFTKLGDSALEFELRVFLSNPEHMGLTRHDLLVAIDRRFRAASIEIPFPQRDVHLKSVDAAAAVALTARPGEAT